jgi:hypothetical protein
MAAKIEALRLNMPLLLAGMNEKSKIEVWHR